MSRSLALRLARISTIIDDHLAAQGIDGKVLLWERVTKCAAEAGEVIEAVHRLDGGNPRKPATTHADVVAELLDVAVAALCAVEHLTGNVGDSVSQLQMRAEYVSRRLEELP